MTALRSIAAFTVVLLVVQAPPVESRRPSSGTATFAPAPQRATPTPYVFYGCDQATAGHNRKQGPWDTEHVYDNILPGRHFQDFCGNLAVCFAIDESGSMGYRNFEKEIMFVRQFVTSLVERVHPDHLTKFSAFLFDGTSAGEDEIALSTTNFSAVIEGLGNVVYDGGCTNIAAGLENCKQQLSGSAAEGRVIVLLSDGGQSVDANDDGVYVVEDEDQHVRELATRIREDGITIVTLELILSGTVGTGPLAAFLAGLASARPDGTKRSYSSSFDGLSGSQLVSDIISSDNGICDQDTVGPAPSNVRPICPCASLDTDNRAIARPRRGTVGQGAGGAITAQCDIVAQGMAPHACDLGAPETVCSTTPTKAWHCSSDISDGDVCDCIEVATTRTVPLF